MDIHYITKESLESFNFETHFVQSWLKDFKHSRSINENLIEDFYLNTPLQFQRDGLVILDHLAHFWFATEDQLKTLLTLKDGVSDENLDEIINSYIKNNILNCFTLAYYQLQNIPENAGKIYCLNIGGKVILNHHHSSDFSYWQTSDVQRGPEQIAKCLTTAMFYLKTLECQCEKLKYFDPILTAFVNRKQIRFAASFEIQQGFYSDYYIFEPIRTSDMPMYWRKKTSEHISSYFANKTWQKTFGAEPYFVLLVESKELMQEAADLFYGATKNPNFYLTTDDEVKNKPNGKTTFYSYMPNLNDPELDSGVFHGKLFESEVEIFI